MKIAINSWLINNFNKKVFKSNERSERTIKNIFSLFIVKGFSIIINLALVPLTINYLSPIKYGVWLTISSMIGWINFFDVGLGHGLRNKLAEAIAKDDMSKAKSYVSTAYVSITIICSVLFLLFIIINNSLNWNTLLNIPKEIDENIKTITLILFSTFAIQFILQLINSILLGNQQPAKVSFFNMLSNLLALAGIFILITYTKESLFNVTFIFSIIPILILAGVNVYFFKTHFKHFSPSINSFDRNALNDILHLGVKFFLIQISVLVFYQTSNLLICRYFSPELVTPYNIAFKYFGIITMVFNIITSPYWSAYTEAYTKKDIAWIKRSIRQLLKVWMLLSILAIIMLVFSTYAYHYWVGDEIKIDFTLSLFMMLYVIIISFGNIFIMFLNGIGNIKLQMIINIISMIAFIPLSYLLAVKLNLGIVGIITSIIICSLYGPLIAPFQVRNILSKFSND